MKIKEMYKGERPREKMFSGGVSTLSNGELLAVLLHTGVPGKDVMELAQELISKSEGKLMELFRWTPEMLMTVEGIGRAKAATLMAVFELGRRFIREQPSSGKKSIVSSRQVYEMMIPQMKGLVHEECWVLFLNTSNRVIKRVMMTKGGNVATIIDSTQIVRTAIECSATGIILVHNHPSGNPTPSTADAKQTGQLKSAAEKCGISLMDHVIVSDDCWFSFSDERISKDSESQQGPL